MRHLNKGRKLNRTSAHRKALFANLATSLFKHECIETTQAKAKDLRGFAERLITIAKEDSVSNRRLAYNRLQDKTILGHLFTEIGPKNKNRPGGYLRVLKCGFRAGDNAPMAIVELVEREALQAE